MRANTQFSAVPHSFFFTAQSKGAVINKDTCNLTVKTQTLWVAHASTLTCSHWHCDCLILKLNILSFANMHYKNMKVWRDDGTGWKYGISSDLQLGSNWEHECQYQISWHDAWLKTSCEWKVELLCCWLFSQLKCLDELYQTLYYTCSFSERTNRASPVRIKPSCVWSTAIIWRTIHHPLTALHKPLIKDSQTPWLTPSLSVLYRGHKDMEIHE